MSGPAGGSTAMRTARRRARLLAGLIVRPGDGWLAVRMVGWRLALPVLKRRMTLPRLVSLMWQGEQARAPSPERQARVAELTTSVFRSDHRDRPGNCLDRSLVLYRYLSAAGADPKLMVGMRRGEQDALRGHAWVTVDGEPVEESTEPLEEFARLASFRGDGVAAPVR